MTDTKCRDDNTFIQMSPSNENRPKARVSQDKNVKVPGRSKPYLPIHRADGIRKRVGAIDHAGRV